MLQIMHTPWPCIDGVHVARYLKPDSKSGPAITKPKGIHWFRASAARCQQSVVIYGSWYQVSFYAGAKDRDRETTFIFRRKIFLENVDEEQKNLIDRKKETTKNVHISIKVYLVMRYKHFKFS